ncbi:reverse transcriptase domain-containing protein [Tanacetum coccineum]
MRTINRTMVQLLEAPTEGYEDAIVVPEISADNFELKHETLDGITLTWDDLVLKFINRFFPPSKTTNLRNEITRFQQRFYETFYEAWDRLNDLLRACPYHGFSKLHQLDTFYNALNYNDQDLLNHRDCLRIIESKSTIHNSRNKPVVAKVNSSSSPPSISPDVAELKDMVKALLLDKKTIPNSAPVKSSRGKLCYLRLVAHSLLKLFRHRWQRSGTLPSNTITNPKVDLKGITTRSRVAYQGLTIPTTSSSPPKVVEREPEVTKDTVPPTNNGNLSFKISLTDALILMPKFASTLKALIGNKEKLSEMARTTLNEHCSTVILNKLPKKLRDPKKFLIPCDFLGMDECLALVDLGASINLMPLSMWKKLSLPKFTPTCMTLELADLVDFDADPRVPLILGRSFLKTRRALIDVYEGELTHRVGKEVVTFNLDQTSRYSSNYDDNSVNRIDVIEMACEEYSQKFLGFSDVIASGNPTPYYDPIVSTSSPTLTPFGDNDPTSPEVDDSYSDPEGDILLLESFLNDDPSLPPPTKGNYLPEIRKKLKVCDAKTDKSSIDEHPEVELKDLPPHLEYAFLEGDDKLPVIIAKDLSVEEKVVLIKVLMLHKRAIA